MEILPFPQPGLENLGELLLVYLFPFSYVNAKGAEKKNYGINCPIFDHVTLIHAWTKEKIFLDFNVINVQK